MKKAVFDNPNKMHFESAHQTFNMQTVMISTGNVVAPTQLSSYIRKSTETECNGYSSSEHHLQDFDLEPFLKLGANHYREQIKSLVDKTEAKCILYCFFHTTASNNRIVDGFLLTAGHNGNHREVKRWYVNRDWRARDAFEEAIRYVTNSESNQ